MRVSPIEIMRRERIPRHDNEPYLERLIVFRCKWFGIFLHRFVGGDDECMHDHPWNFWTFLLKGGYWEWTPTDPDEVVAMGPETAKWYGPLSLLRRPAESIHRVDIGQQKSVWSLVIHGPKRRSWGFYTKHGWIHHSKYNYTNHCA